MATASANNDMHSFAILGAGEIGLPLATELLAKHYDVRVFTRPGSTNASVAALESRGARRVEVDYTSNASIEAALQGGIDVIISTIGGAAADQVQSRIARVVQKVGGVKLFVPSMWGFDYDDPVVTDPEFFNPAIASKLNGLSELEAFGLPWISISNGLFSSWSFMSAFGIDAVGRKAELKINGQQKVSFTNLADIAAFTRHVITTQPLPEPGKGRWYYVEGYKASFNEVLEEAQRIDGEGRPWTVSQVPGAVEEAQRHQQELSEVGIYNWVMSSISNGRALRSESDNGKVGFTPAFGFQQSVQEALELSRRK